MCRICFQTLTQEEALAKCPYTRMYPVVSQYCADQTKAQAGGPGVSQFLDPNSILSPCKKPGVSHILENKLRELKSTYLPLLGKRLGLMVAKLELAV